MKIEAARQSFESSCHFYGDISLYCGIAAVGFLLAAVILFFVLDIPRVFGEITGGAARRAVRQMADYKSGDSGAAEVSRARDGADWRLRKGAAAISFSRISTENRPGKGFALGSCPALESCRNTETEGLVREGAETPALLSESSAAGWDKFVILRSIVEIHTDETM